jgi:hypothetical protein
MYIANLTTVVRTLFCSRSINIPCNNLILATGPSTPGVLHKIVPRMNPKTTLSGSRSPAALSSCCSTLSELLSTALILSVSALTYERGTWDISAMY